MFKKGINKPKKEKKVWKERGCPFIRVNLFFFNLLTLQHLQKRTLLTMQHLQQLHYPTYSKVLGLITLEVYNNYIKTSHTDVQMPN